MKPVEIPPNRPVFVALLDCEGAYDFERERGTYQTTDGRLLTLPRPAVVQLNQIEPKPGQEIRILKSWTGKNRDKPRWTVQLSTRNQTSEPTKAPRRPADPVTPPETKRTHQERPMPIERPSRKQPAAEEQPRLFDCQPQGNGTTGPAPRPVPFMMPARARGARPDQIPANVAVREILHFINADPNTVNWGDQAKQDLASTIIIAAYRAGHIGLWERK